MSTGDVIVVITPLIIPVIIGYVVVWLKLAAASDAHVLSTLFFYVAAPALIIVTLAREDIGDLFEYRLVVGFLAVGAIVQSGVYMVYRQVLGRDQAVAAFASFAASKFNALSLGLPAMIGLLGSRAIIPVVVATIVTLSVQVPVTVTLVDLGKAGASTKLRDTLRTAARSTATNPIVIATAVGVVIAAMDVTLPVIVSSSLSTLGGAAVLLALVALGMTLDLGDLRSGGGEVLALSAVKCFVAPAVALMVALMLETSDFFAAAMVILFCQPTAKVVFAMAEQEQTFVKPVAGVVALTTVAAIVVLPLWVAISDNVWPDAFSM
ncbi:MAG: AEC family transporter [Actinomycetota bacterium]